MVGQSAFGFALNRQGKQYLAVLLDKYNVCMIVYDSDLGIVFAVIYGNDNVKGKTVVKMMHLDRYIC